MISSYNTNCYHLKHLHFKQGFLDPSVDITYIITMSSDRERHKKINQQLKKFIPTKKIVIVYNDGYRKCPKYKDGKLINITYQDLTYTNMYIFELAKNYGNILVLEDDFVFSETILNQDVLRDVNDFINTRKPSVYYLGLTPCFINILTIFNKHTETYQDSSNHAVIYSKKTRNQLTNLYHSRVKIGHIDDDYYTGHIKNRYFYYKPLCMQSFPETENKKYWFDNPSTNPIYRKLHYYSTKLGIAYQKLLKLDQDGNLDEKYRLNYKIIKIFHIMVAAFLIYLLLVILRRLAYLGK